MHVQFDTNEISKRDALCLMALLENIAGVEVPLHIVTKEAGRHESAEKPEVIKVEMTTALPSTASVDLVPERRKPGRPRKADGATPVQLVDGPLPEEPATGSAGPAASEPASEAPITLDALRDVVNDHVSKYGMPSAQIVLKKFGCERVTAVMDLEVCKQHELLAELKK